MNFSDTLGNLIRQARNQKQIGQADLSAAMGYPYNIVAKLENGLSKPTFSQWKRLRELLDGTLDLKAAGPLLQDGLVEDKPDESTISLKPIDTGVAQRLRELRELLGYTFSYVAGQLGTSEAQLLKLEAGHVEASYTELRQVAKLYRTSYEYILDGIERG